MRRLTGTLVVAYRGAIRRIHAAFEAIINRGIAWNCITVDSPTARTNIAFEPATIERIEALASCLTVFTESTLGRINAV